MMFTLAGTSVRSTTFVMPCCAMSVALSVVIEIGVVCRFSSVRRAVTMISLRCGPSDCCSVSGEPLLAATCAEASCAAASCAATVAIIKDHRYSEIDTRLFALMLFSDVSRLSSLVMLEIMDVGRQFPANIRGFATRQDAEDTAAGSPRLGTECHI